MPDLIPRPGRPPLRPGEQTARYGLRFFLRVDHLVSLVREVFVMKRNTAVFASGITAIPIATKGSYGSRTSQKQAPRPHPPQPLRNEINRRIGSGNPVSTRCSYGIRRRLRALPKASSEETGRLSRKAAESPRTISFSSTGHSGRLALMKTQAPVRKPSNDLLPACFRSEGRRAREGK